MDPRDKSTLILFGVLIAAVLLLFPAAGELALWIARQP